MRKRRKWGLYGAFLALLLLFGFYQFFAYVLKDTWSERKEAEAIATSRAALTEIDRTQKSIWDENAIYWVLTGKNKAGTDMMVWVRFTTDGKPVQGDSAVHAEELSQGTSEKRMRQIIASSLPGIQIKRLLPGAYNGEYAWQLFYKEGDRYYYRFYRFSDGEQIGDGYSLPNR